MHQVKKLNIRIVDTEENNRSLLFEDTQIESPRLKYNGQADKFSNLMTSELHFNLLVKTVDEGVFFHLFTGSENRFKVVLEDVTDAENIVVKWVGYLLPEQFAEPYKNKSYFVEFVATDGIGRLKNINSPVFYDADKQSVLDVLYRCLCLTGLKLPIMFAPAIQNAGFKIDYKDLLVDTSVYRDKDVLKSSYDVILGLLESLGCRLFQQDTKWFIVGLHLLNDTSITFHKYIESDFFKLTRTEDVVIERPVLEANILAAPTLEILPVLNKMETTWKTDTGNYLIPENAVTSFPVNYTTNEDSRVPQFWQLQKSKNIVLSTLLFFLDPNFDYRNIDRDLYFDGFKAIKSVGDNTDVFGPNVMIVSLQDVALLDLQSNFISLENSFYIEGSTSLERYATLKIGVSVDINVLTDVSVLNNFLNKKGRFTSVTETVNGVSRLTIENHGLVSGNIIEIENPPTYVGNYIVTVIDNNTVEINVPFNGVASGDYKLLAFAENFYFSIVKETVKDSGVYTTVLSNFPDVDVPDNRFGFNVSLKDNAIVAELELEKIILDESGFYNLRLYPHISNEMLSNRTVFTECEFTLNVEEDIEIVKEQNNKFTTAHSLDVFHSSSSLGLSKKSFFFSEDLQNKLDAGLLPQSAEQIDIVFYNVERVFSLGFLWYRKIEVGLSVADALKLQNGFSLFVQKNGTGNLLELSEDFYTLNNNKILQLDFLSNANLFVEQSDLLFIGFSNGGNALTNYADYWLNRWSLVGSNNSLSFLECLNNMYLSILNEFNFMLSGTVLRLLNPLDLFLFNYKGERNYMFSEAFLNLTEGETELTLVECKRSVLAQEESVVDTSLPDLNLDDNLREINIAARAIAPSFGVFVWSINVTYSLLNFAEVNAVLTATKLTDSIANNGVKTNFVKRANIVNANGSFVFTFSFDVFADNGWYEVVLEQDGVVSNKEYVAVFNTATTPETFDIVITKADSLAVAIQQQDYLVDYKVPPVGIVEQYLQRFNIATQANVGNPEITQVSSSSLLNTIDFTNRSGAYKVRLKNNNKFSNEISFFGF